MLGELVTVITAGTITDPYSNGPVEAFELQPDQAWLTEPDERSVTTIAPLEPRPSDEPVEDARNSVTSGWTLYLPAGDPINRKNRVRVRGIEYPVQGEPAAWGPGVVAQAFHTEG